MWGLWKGYSRILLVFWDKPFGKQFGKEPYNVSISGSPLLRMEPKKIILNIAMHYLHSINFFQK